MPKSKREKVVHLTKTTKKGMGLKEKLVETVRDAIAEYSSIYLITVDNMRNNKFKELREEWKDSRFFFGKNKVMALALGINSADEMKNNLHKISERLVGKCGLLFTNKSHDEVASFFDEYSIPNFARSGFKSTMDFNLSAGPLDDLPFSMEALLRKLGLNTKLNEGVPTLLVDTAVCKKGDILTPEQCKLLEIFKIEMAVMKVRLLCKWHDEDFEVLDDAEVEDGEMSEDD
jgi:mRNA turnover protein 4